jgi:hypothetical protein
LRGLINRSDWVVELRSVSGYSFLKRPTNHIQGFLAIFLQFCLETLEPKFIPCCIHYLESSVRVKCEDVSVLWPNLAGDKIRRRKNAQRHVWAFQSCYFVDPGRKAQNGRVACKSDPQSVSTLGEKTKCDEHLWLFQGVEYFVQPCEKFPVSSPELNSMRAALLTMPITTPGATPSTP